MRMSAFFLFSMRPNTHTCESKIVQLAYPPSNSSWVHKVSSTTTSPWSRVVSWWYSIVSLMHLRRFSKNCRAVGLLRCEGWWFDSISRSSWFALIPLGKYSNIVVAYAIIDNDFGHGKCNWPLMLNLFWHFSTHVKQTLSSKTVLLHGLIVIYLGHLGHGIWTGRNSTYCSSWIVPWIVVRHYDIDIWCLW